MKLRMKDIPNLLTTARFFLIPVFVYVFFAVSPPVALCVFILAGITDIVDGYLARKYDAITDWGKLMDPLADKLMTLMAVVCLVIKHYIPIAFVVILFIKELLMVLGAVFLFRRRQVVVKSDWLGKGAAAVMSIAVGLAFFKPSLPWVNYVLYASLALSLAALVHYTFLNLLGRGRQGR